MKFVIDHSVNQKRFFQNMEAKMLDSLFLGDITSLVRPDEKYNPYEVNKLVKTELLEKSKSICRSK
jgi:hypothetical protein